MYETHFGLTSRPFGSKAEGAGVFSGPRQVETMTNLKKGLKALDAVVTVTGPVGVGKTSIVGRALDTISPNRMAAWVGRMQLAPDEVLQLLLAGFGIKRQANGTIQRFAQFRRLLAERAAAGAPVAIVVEDAQRIGVDALAELEALTAADTGDGMSANIILMGQPELKKLLAKPELARLNQRTRLRQAIEPLSEAEVNGYLRHCLRVAGGDYDKVFEAGVAEIVYSCSEGIPRMVNTLCETALTTAMEDGVKTVSAALMHKVAVDAFGFEGPLPEVAPDTPSEESVEVPIIEVKVDPAVDAGPTVAEPEPDRQPVPAETKDAASPVEPEPSKADAEPEDEDDMPPSARDMIVESGHYPELPKDPEDSAIEPAPVANVKPEEVEPESEAEFVIPELINDTQPELSVLPPPKSDEAVEELDLETESTAIQEQLGAEAISRLEAGSQQPPAIDSGDPEPSPAQEESPEKPGTHDDNAGDKETFDLDAALTFETEATNVMQGITANLDDVAAEPGNDESADGPETTPAVGDLPTLTDSMKIDVKKEVEKTRQQDVAPKVAPETPPAVAADATKKPESPPAAAVAEIRKPEPPAAATVDKTKKPEAPLAEAVIEPEKPAKPQAAPAPPEPSPVATAEKSPKPIAKVSEMTARIAALDPSSRKNDIESVEAALDAAKRGKLDELMAPPPLPQVSEGVAPEEEAPAPIPEITLDDEIEKKQKAAAAKREKFAAEIGSANSLEEFSDAMAETLFGDEDFDAIAAEVVANPPAEGQLVDGSADNGEPGPGGDSVTPSAPAAEQEAAPQDDVLRPDLLVSLDAANTQAPADPAEAAEKPAAPPAPAGKSSQPDSIENQFTTSMTQTLEALNVTKAADAAAAESESNEEPEKKGGFFSRFRKSS